MSGTEIGDETMQGVEGGDGGGVSDGNVADTAAAVGDVAVMGADVPPIMVAGGIAVDLSLDDETVTAQLLGYTVDGLREYADAAEISLRGASKKMEIAARILQALRLSTQAVDEVVDEAGSPEHFVPDLFSADQWHESFRLNGIPMTVRYLIGAASRMWDNEGVFRSEDAALLADKFTRALERRMEMNPNSRLPTGETLD